MDFLRLIFIHFLPTLGFLLAFLFLVHLFRSNRSPAATFAWLLAIVLIPYIGVPCYIFFGGRKMKRMTRMKRDIESGSGIKNFSVEDKDFSRRNETFPLRSGNKIRLLAKGTDAYHAFIQGIHNAKRSIYIATYVLGDDSVAKEILSALTKKAKEGVEVRLLLDDIGSVKAPRKELSILKDAGGYVGFFMPMIRLPFRGRANLRNHRKIILIDRKSAIVGGRNIADEYMGPEEDLKRWKDLSLFAEGPVVRDLFSIFYSDWNFACKEKLEEWSVQDESEVIEGGTPIQVMPSGPDVSGDFLQQAIVESIFGARERYWIVTPYFVPNEMLLSSLKMAVRRGVDVRIYVPKKSNHLLADLVRKEYVRELQEAGVRVLKYLPTMLHGKLFIVDQDRAFTGSANMDLRSLFLNYEVAFLIHSKEEVQKLAEWVNSLDSHCVETKDKANLIEDIIEGMGRLLAPLV